MTSSYHSPAVAIPRHPIHAMLVPFPAVCFTLTLLTDIAFWQTSNIMWQNFSAWLLFAGLAFGVLALIVGAVDFLARREASVQGSLWLLAIGKLAVLGLAFLNSLVHAGDGWTAVVPYGLILSLVTVLVAAATAWLGRSRVVHHEIGASRHE